MLPWVLWQSKLSHLKEFNSSFFRILYIPVIKLASGDMENSFTIWIVLVENVSIYFNLD